MPREIPDFWDGLKMPSVDSGRRYDIGLITPMFGGGVETRTSDPSFPIRPTAIRGQLQFWWRATVGATYATKQELRKAQSGIWGCTEQASRVQVLVEHDSNAIAPPVACARFEKDWKNPGKYRSMPTWNEPFGGTALPYALFPFQGQLAKGRTQIEVPPAECITRARFRLTIRCPDELWAQVEPAIWAWINFGGIGSRTRRGCGALFCNELAPRDCDHLIAQIEKFVSGATVQREWPTFAKAVLLGGSPTSPINAWDQVIEPLKRFRQGVGLGRNPGRQTNRPGRSRFPEPETIRRVTGWRSGQHGRLGNIPDDAFPRAEFGLPIVFHFKDDFAGDPKDTVLYPSNGSDGQRRERMASPLILKPLALKDGRTLPLILQLNAPPLQDVDLRQADASLALPPATTVRDLRLSSYGGSGWKSPLAASRDGSVLEAFLAFVHSQGISRVAP